MACHHPAASIIRLRSLSWIMDQVLHCHTDCHTLSHQCHTLPILSHRCHKPTWELWTLQLSPGDNVHAPPNTRYMHSAKPSSAPPRAHIKTVFHGATESVPSALREEDKLSKCGLSGIDFFNFHWVLLRQTFARTNAMILSSKFQSFFCCQFT